MSRMEFVDLGRATVVRLTRKAVLVRLADHDDDEHWFPQSSLATDTAAGCAEWAELDRFRVEAWIARDRELVE